MALLAGAPCAAVSFHALCFMITTSLGTLWQCSPGRFCKYHLMLTQSDSMLAFAARGLCALASMGDVDNLHHKL